MHGRNFSQERVMYLITAIVVILGFCTRVLVSANSNSPGCPLSPPICNVLESLRLTGYLSFSNTSFAAQDFGMLESSPPAAVLFPGCEQDIASVIAAVNTLPSLTIAARGPGHSVNGQCQALHGIVIEMSTLTGIVVNTDKMFVEASAGELWVDVVKATLQEGLTPKSFTDYLHLSVGGTLSNAGCGGQAFLWGPQIANVLQLEVITGLGDCVTCSRDQNSDLFFAALGGLGQFGIITKARISLQPSYPTVRWVRAIYSDFTLLKQDQELLISQANGFDFIEGEVISNTASPAYGYNSAPFSGTGQAVNTSLLPSNASTTVLYYIELVKYYNNNTQSQNSVDEEIGNLLAPLRFIPTQVFSIDTSYYTFLERVYTSQLLLESLGEWDVPHPYQDIFVPSSQIVGFDQAVFKTFNLSTISGPVRLLPMNRNKWDLRMSAQTPDEDLFVLVAFLWSVIPSGPSLATLEGINAKALKYCKSLGCKEYIPTYSTLTDWETHFGAHWSTFLGNKIKFDPQAILAPGQDIFTRDQVPPVK